MTGLIDFSRIQETSDGDIAFEVELLELYLRDSREHVDRIQMAVTGGDLESIHLLAHGLKGTSYSVGADRLGDLALQIELAATQVDSPETQQIVDALTAVFAETKKIIQSYIDAAA